MDLEVLRYSSGKETTLGLLSIIDVPEVPAFLCYTLEDQNQVSKVNGETRIPEGCYEITLRTVGGKHATYAARYPDMHHGMLWVRNVPGFEYILIHVGNTDDDTEGCLLLGNTASQNVIGEGSIGSSRAAYERVYPLIAKRLLAGDRTYITYIDHG
jgi:hypothetical protein